MKFVLFQILSLDKKKCYPTLKNLLPHYHYPHALYKELLFNIILFSSQKNEVLEFAGKLLDMKNTK